MSTYSIVSWRQKSDYVWILDLYVLSSSPTECLLLAHGNCRNLNTDHQLICKLTLNYERLFVYGPWLQHSGWIKAVRALVAVWTFVTILSLRVRMHTEDGGCKSVGDPWDFPPVGSHPHPQPLEEFHFTQRQCSRQYELCIFLRFPDLGYSNEFQLEIQPRTWYSFSFRS